MAACSKSVNPLVSISKGVTRARYQCSWKSCGMPPQGQDHVSPADLTCQHHVAETCLLLQFPVRGLLSRLSGLGPTTGRKPEALALIVGAGKQERPPVVVDDDHADTGTQNWIRAVILGCCHHCSLADCRHFAARRNSAAISGRRHCRNTCSAALTGMTQTSTTSSPPGGFVGCVTSPISPYPTTR